MVLALSGAGADAGLGRDGHQGLADGLLPALGHLQANAGGRQRRVVVVAAGVLPHVVNHGVGDDLEAVRVASLSEVTEVMSRIHLKDLRQRDFLWRTSGAEADRQMAGLGL